MSILGWLKGHRNAAISTVVVAALVGTLTAAAARYDGFEQPNVSLNDGGVWVTNESKQLVGRLNHPAGTLDGVLNVGASDFDLMQYGNNVVVNNQASSAHRYDTINPSTVQKSGGMAAPSAIAPAFGGNTMALANDEGNVWVVPASAISGFDPTKSKPLLTEVKDPLLAVSVDGTRTFAYSKAERIMHEVALVGNRYEKVATEKVEDFSGGPSTQITVVGSEVVLFDAPQGNLWSSGTTSRITVDGYTPENTDHVQEPGAAAASVLIGTRSAVIQAPLTGGAAIVHTAGQDGVAIPPANFNNCVYGAWGGSRKMLRKCGSDAAIVQDIPQVNDGAELRFRMNHKFIVLNNLKDGNTWLVAKNLELVNNWTQNTTGDASAPNSDEKSDDVIIDINGDAKPNREKNDPPTAKPDTYGVRPGATLLMPVTLNDTDPNGDVLTVRAAPATIQPQLARLETVLNNTAFQAKVPADAKPGQYSYTYIAQDGRADSPAASVTINVVAPDVAKAPEPRPGKTSKARVAAGGTVTYDVLNDWRSPQGDPIFLKTAKLDDTFEGHGTVQFTPDGEITYRDSGRSLGKKVINFAVADDHGQENTRGKLEIEVMAADQAKPVLSPDHIRVPVGQTITLEPLRNDYDPTGGNLTLSSVELAVPKTGLTVTSQGASGRVEVSSDTPNSYIVNYSAAGNGPSETSFIRVDVVENSTEQDPIAVNDIAVLPYGGSRLLGALDNDSDPLGGVLSISDVRVPQGAFFRVEMLQHSVLRVTSLRASTEPASFEYTVTNAVGSATGTVLVSPLQAPEVLLPPQPRDDFVRVRAGDVQTVPVTTNDVDPQGAKLTVKPELINETPALGDAFVTEGKIRFHAKGAPGVALIRYNVANGGGMASATLKIEIVPADAVNEPPQPGVIRGRTVTNQKITIPLDLSKADPNGDSVTITAVGTTTPPKIGKIVGHSDGAITYEAYGDTGTDTFSFTVTDAFGATGEGIAYVGISRPSAAQPGPTAVPDQVDARPSTRFAVPVLANDYSPTGAALSVVPDGLSAAQGVTVTFDDGQVVVQTPEAEGDYSFSYIVTDGVLTDSAPVTIKVRAAAELKLPVAGDDFVPHEEAKKLATFTVPVTTNDVDPMGVNSSLKVELVDAQGKTVPKTATASVQADQSVTVAFTYEPQVIRYRVTNIQFGTSTDAFVHVPAKPRPPEKPKPNEPEPEPEKPKRVAPEYNDSVLTVNAGETVEVPVARYVKALPEGRTPVITDVTAASATKSTLPAGDPMVKDASTLIYAPAADASGKAVITVKVSDGPADDADAVSATLAIQVQVVEQARKKPDFAPRDLEVEQAGDAVSVDLKSLTTSNNSTPQLAWSLGTPLPEGYEVSLRGSTLSVQASELAAPGVIPMTVTDGDASTATTGEIKVSTVSSKQPLATVTAQTVEALGGKPVTVNVLEGATNPFPDAPLVLLPEGLTFDSDKVAVTASGDSLTVTPVEGTFGLTAIEFSVADGTGDPSRYVQGTLTVNVKAKPERVAAVRVKGIGDGYVDLEWQAPANNGSDITEYAVAAATGPLDAPFVCGTQTVCRIEGLTNNQSYTFTVTAKSAAGTSEPSLPSTVARPDRLPGAPGAPRLRNNNGELVVEWTPPAATNRSPDVSYDVQISPSLTNGSQTLNVAAPSTTVRLGAVALGTVYSVKVRANNSAGANGSVGHGEWSEASSEKPSKPPVMTGSPRVIRVNSNVGGSIHVSWTAATANGDPVTNYVVTATAPGQPTVTRTVAGNATSVPIEGLEVNSTYSFSVQAKNRDGMGPESGRSVAIKPFAVPAAPTNVVAKQTNAGMSTTPGANMTVTWTAPNTYGARLTGYQVSYLGKTVNVAADKTTLVSPAGITNGQSVNFTVRAVTADVTGASASSPAVVPYGKPTLGELKTLGYNVGTKYGLTWSWPEVTLNGNQFARYELTDATTQTFTDISKRTITIEGERNRSMTLNVTLVTKSGVRVSQSQLAFVDSGPIMNLSKGDRCTAISTTTGLPFQGNNLRALYVDIPPGTTSSVRWTDHPGLPSNQRFDQGVFEGSTDNKGNMFGSRNILESPGGEPVCLADSSGPYRLQSTLVTPLETITGFPKNWGTLEDIRQSSR